MLVDGAEEVIGIDSFGESKASGKGLGEVSGDFDASGDRECQASLDVGGQGAGQRRAGLKGCRDELRQAQRLGFIDGKDALEPFAFFDNDHCTRGKIAEALEAVVHKRREEAELVEEERLAVDGSKQVAEHSLESVDGLSIGGDDTNSSESFARGLPVPVGLEEPSVEPGEDEPEDEPEAHSEEYTRNSEKAEDGEEGYSSQTQEKDLQNDVDDEGGQSAEGAGHVISEGDVIRRDDFDTGIKLVISRGHDTHYFRNRDGGQRVGDGWLWFPGCRDGLASAPVACKKGEEMNYLPGRNRFGEKPMDISGKRVLVTGGGSGVGLGIALGLAEEGCRVVISGRNEDKLEAAAAEFKGEPGIQIRACDVGDRDDVKALFAWVEENLGGIDILVNSAGVNTANRRFDVLDPADWDKLMQINATGAFNTMYCAVPWMREQGGGLIVNISSIAGKRGAELAGPAYCASKFAMTALGTAVGLEERENNIHITNVYPGEVNTPILAERPVPPPPEKLEKMLLPEDIASMVVALAKLHPRALVNELVITPLYQGYA